MRTHQPHRRTKTYFSTHLQSLMFTLTILLLLNTPSFSQSNSEPAMRILMTNDDGIEEVRDRVYPVAQHLRKFAEVYIVVSNQDRSGSTNFMSLNRKISIESRLDYFSAAGDGLHKLEIHVVDGFPADCVVLGIQGIMRDNPPDIVISGPNGGPNLADAWFGSGTIGAARTAAFLGVPALAISGLDHDEPAQVTALAQWVAQLAQSELVRTLPELTYLTIGLPRIPPSEIAGIQTVHRARTIESLSLKKLAEFHDEDDEDETITIWALQESEEVPPAEGSDLAFFAQKYIIITPMRADEHDNLMLNTLTENPEEIPAWPPGK